MATVLRQNSEGPDILPLMNGQDTSLLYIGEDVHRIKSHYRDTNYDSVKSNRSMSLYDPNITGTLAGNEEVSISHATYDVSKGIDNVKTTYTDVITPRKFALQDGSPPGKGQSSNLGHGTRANGDVKHIANEDQTTVQASSTQMSSVARANLNDRNGNTQQGNSRQSTANDSLSTEHVQLSNTSTNNQAVLTVGGRSINSSNRNSQNDEVELATVKSTQHSAPVKKTGSFQIRSSMNRDSYESENSSKATSIEGSADITLPSNGVTEVATNNQEIKRLSSQSSSKERQSRPSSTNSAAPSYMRDTNASQAKRASRTSEQSFSASSDKPTLHRSTSKTSSSGSRPPSGQVTGVRTSVASSKRHDSSSSQSSSPAKGGTASRSSSARRSEASNRQTSPSPSRNSMVRSSSLKRDSFSHESPPASPIKVIGTPPRTPSFKSDRQGHSSSSHVSRISYASSNNGSRSSSTSRPRRPSQEYTSPVRDSVTASETSTARNSVASVVSSKPPSRTPSASKPPSGSTPVSRQSSQKQAASSAVSASRTPQRSAGKFIMKHAPGIETGQSEQKGNTPTSERTSETSKPIQKTGNFELNANLLTSQKSQLKTNGSNQKARTYVSNEKKAFTPNQKKPAKFQVNTSQSSSDVIVSTPLSPMEEMRSTVKSGTVGKLVKDFKATPLTGRLFDPSSLERNKKAAESQPRKFKFSVEGIDVPVSPSTDSEPQLATASPVTPGVVPAPPPISAEILNQVTSNSNPSTLTRMNTETTEITSTMKTGEGPMSPVPMPPPPPPPPDFSDSTPVSSLERGKKRGFTYIPDDKVVPMMKKKAEDVMARKPHEAVEVQVQSKRTSEYIHDQEVATLREARAKLHRQDKSPTRQMPSPPDYSTATNGNSAAISISGETHKKRIDHDSKMNSQKSSNISSTNIQISANNEVIETSSKRSSVKTDISSDQVTVNIDGYNRAGNKTVTSEGNVKLDKSVRNSAEIHSNSERQSEKHVNSVNITTVSVKTTDQTDGEQKLNMDGAGSAPESPVKSQRSPDSAYYSDAHSPGFDLRKQVAPSLVNGGIQQDVTVQRAAFGGQGGPEQGARTEEKQSFQSATLHTAGQSARDSAEVGSTVVPESTHQVIASPLTTTSYTYDGLLTTRSSNEEESDPYKPHVNTHGSLHTIISTSSPPANTSHFGKTGTEEDDSHFRVHIQPAQGSHRITVGGSQNSPFYSKASHSHSQENYSSLPRSEGSYNHRQSTPSHYNRVSPSPSRQGRHTNYPSSLGSRIVPLHPVSVDISSGNSPKIPYSRHQQTVRGMSAMAGEVMQPFAQFSSGGGRNMDYTDGRFVAEQYNFSTYERSTKQFNGNGHAPEVDGNSAFNFNSQSINSNVPPKRKYIKLDESRANGRPPTFNGDLESYEYHQHSNRSPRYKIHSSRTTDDVFEDDSIHSEPVYRHQKHGMYPGRRLQKQHIISRSQPHLNELGHPNSLGEPLYVSVPHSPPRYGTMRSARSETMLAQQSPSGETALLLPHLEDAKSKSRAKYPYHITLKLNQLAGSRPGSSHISSVQRSSRDGYYNSLQSSRQQTQSLSGIYQGGRHPMHTSSVSLVNIEHDPRSPTGQQPVRYREDGSYSRQEKYSYQQQQHQQPQQQDAYVFNGSLPRSYTESSQVINTNVGSPQTSGEKQFFLKIDNMPDNERNNNNYIWKTSSSSTERAVNKRQQNRPTPSGKDPDFTMAINQTMTMDYLPKKKKREEEPRRQKVRRSEDEVDYHVSRTDKEDRFYNEIPRVERGSYLIKNSIDTTSAPQHIDVVDDNLDGSFNLDNANVFHQGYVSLRENPVYDSEEEEVYFEKKQHTRPHFTKVFEREERTTEEDVVDIPVSYTKNYETSFSRQAKKPAQRMDRTDYEERISTQRRSEPRMSAQTTTTERVEITEHELERLLKGAPPGSVKQTINVEREEEEILGPLPITHADGEESAVDGLLNFDTVSEKVELGIVRGQAQLTVKVRCERVVPIRGVDDMFKKSSVIVTRLIEIDMEATRERRHLLENIMAGASKRTLNESTGHVRHSGQKTLDTKDTFQLYKTFMAMAEAEEGRDTKGSMHVEKRLEDERGLPDHAEFDIHTEDVDERVFGQPVEMEFDTDDLERRLESQITTNGITNGTRLEAMPNGRGHVIRGQDPDTISYRSAASGDDGIIY